MNSYNICFTEDQVYSLWSYINLLSKWNKSKRIIGKISEIEVITDLILDSVLPVIWIRDEVCLVDIGSGGGIPAIPLKIFLPNLNLFMVEPVGKKVSFLKEAIRGLGLRGVTIYKGRVEEVSHELSAVGAEIAISRAVGRPPSLIKTLQKCGLHFRHLICYLGGKSSKVSFFGENLGPFALKDRLEYLIPSGKRRCLILLQDMCYSESNNSGPFQTDEEKCRLA
ncbi:MAG: 16S rRNA (guanine(527)-N(7))-methyltransferase RsmG [Desulfatiglandales bacterium]